MTITARQGERLRDRGRQVRAVQPGESRAKIIDAVNV